VPGHLLELQGITKEEIEVFFLLADSYFPSIENNRTFEDLKGSTLANLFFESSTRTANSFYLAARKLGATVLDFTGAGSSLSKGETLIDTARNIMAMGVDLFVVRHVAPGAPHMIARELGVPVINAGDGAHEHPTQGLLDAYTLYREFASWKHFENLKVTIVGDLVHSRVARSDIYALKALGACVTCVGPPQLVPETFRTLGCEVSHDLDSVLPQSDVLMFLRLQKERMNNGEIASLREYKKLYGMTKARLKRCPSEILLMHPGPVNRGVELDPDVADAPQSLILKQVTSGLAIRMAVLKKLMGGDTK
jgi:aspartate carbamoyltransferase catalytic subunit